MTYLKGTLLHTKDGSKVGNAIIIDVLSSIETSNDVFAVHTDFGNTSFYTKEEVDELYNISSIVDVETWQRDRFYARIKPIVQPSSLTAKD